MAFNEQSHPRTPAGSPDGGKFATKPGGSEADAVLLDDGGQVHHELAALVHQTMLDRLHMDPGTDPSAQITARAATDYMQLPDMMTAEQQARWAIEDVRDAAEVDTSIVAGLHHADAMERIADGEVVGAKARIDGEIRTGEAFRSSTPGKTWFIADNPYPDAYRGDDAVNDKLKSMLLSSPATSLRVDDPEGDNDYDLLFEAANHDEHTAQVAWDFLRNGGSNRNQINTVAEVVNNSRTVKHFPESLFDRAPGPNGVHAVDTAGEPVFIFRDSSRPDHVWVMS